MAEVMVHPGTLATSGAQNGQEAVNTTASVAEKPAPIRWNEPEFAKVARRLNAEFGAYLDATYGPGGTPSDGPRLDDGDERMSA